MALIVNPNLNGPEIASLYEDNPERTIPSFIEEMRSRQGERRGDWYVFTPNQIREIRR